ncbi:MAG: alpha/beta hydrolase [Verrucomicrobiales bacterium]|nr:alpha/beta hydrolase [Verrucomicrobiales bacterium]
MTFSRIPPAQSSTPRLPLWSEAAPAAQGPAPSGTASLTVYRPPKPNGAIVVICPGGGYGGLAREPEGDGIARWLNRHNLTGVVLEYRMPAGNHAVPLLDAQRALRWTRSQAKDWGCDPDRIGIIGFSAGGHLASTAATHFDAGNPQANDPVERFGCRPNFAILVYPVITMGAWTHNGSKQNLMGSNPSPEVVKWFSNELQVTEQTPPTFLAHPRDDRVVPPENSRQFYRALGDHGVPSRYLELPRGDHGLNGYQGPMWDAWQTGALRWLAELKFIPADDAETVPTQPHSPPFPDFASLATGPQQIRLLPGVGQFVFSLYGVPGDPATVRQLVDVLRDRGLGNGFDPGPGPGPGTATILDELAANGWPVVFYSGGEMQIKGGRAVFGPEHEAALAGMDRAGIFCAYQLGEWGYYFHNLSHHEAWWRDVYGADYETFKHLKKPAGLAGYDRRPASRQECHAVLKDYFESRSRDLLGRVISVTGHSHYEAYAGEWGARCIGLELGENIAFTQSKIAFARGAARSWSKPWSVQVSPWFGPSCTTRGELRTEGGIVRGLDAGHSLSFYERMWLHGWFAGTAMVTPENSIAIFFEKDAAPWPLTEHGHKAAEIFRLMTSHTRGIPYTPVAVVLDRFAGYNGYMDKPWGILEPTPGDRECRDLFDHQLFPGSDHIHNKPDPNNPEASYLRATPYGEIFDVLLSSAPPEILSSYPVILLAGDHEFHPAFLGELEKALRRGRRVLMSQRHRDALGAEFERLSRQGVVEVLEAWTHPATGRATAIGNPRLQALARDLLPFDLTGDPVHYAINRTPTGWVIELINNTGVTKRGHQPAVVDSQANIRVGVHSKFDTAQVKAWRAGRDFGVTNRVDLVLGPGAVEFLEWMDPRP